ncbi:uncharacterized protein SCODWIG_03436 [Saccharomycodes ludwigii]|uniref:Zn(2)-C6 fungal-type domain-containing protein n=1 Tax=Saccharomycodes ludwigii TaxID=36035 RepID=A0A376BAG2_9ASCO|nr:uncharacterized protein SCODWIG_03436 [Saccharomycodes ludwigii]
MKMVKKYSPDIPKKKRTPACAQCRKRKIGCDRARPMCGNCVKYGKTDCFYPETPGAFILKDDGSVLPAPAGTHPNSKKNQPFRQNDLLNVSAANNLLGTNTTPINPATQAYYERMAASLSSNIAGVSSNVNYNNSTTTATTPTGAATGSFSNITYNTVYSKYNQQNNNNHPDFAINPAIFDTCEVSYLQQDSLNEELQFVRNRLRELENLQKKINSDNNKRPSSSFFSKNNDYADYIDKTNKKVKTESIDPDLFDKDNGEFSIFVNNVAHKTPYSDNTSYFGGIFTVTKLFSVSNKLQKVKNKAMNSLREHTFYKTLDTNTLDNLITVPVTELFVPIDIDTCLYTCARFDTNFIYYKIFPEGLFHSYGNIKAFLTTLDHKDIKDDATLPDTPNIKRHPDCIRKAGKTEISKQYIYSLVEVSFILLFTYYSISYSVLSKPFDNDSASSSLQQKYFESLAKMVPYLETNLRYAEWYYGANFSNISIQLTDKMKIFTMLNLYHFHIEKQEFFSNADFCCAIDISDNYNGKMPADLTKYVIKQHFMRNFLFGYAPFSFGSEDHSGSVDNGFSFIEEKDKMIHNSIYNIQQNKIKYSLKQIEEFIKDWDIFKSGDPLPVSNGTNDNNGTDKIANNVLNGITTGRNNDTDNNRFIAPAEVHKVLDKTISELLYHNMMVYMKTYYIFNALQSQQQNSSEEEERIRTQNDQLYQDFFQTVLQAVVVVFKNLSRLELASYQLFYSGICFNILSAACCAIFTLYEYNPIKLRILLCKILFLLNDLTSNLKVKTPFINEVSTLLKLFLSNTKKGEEEEKKSDITDEDVKKKPVSRQFSKKVLEKLDELSNTIINDERFDPSKEEELTIDESNFPYICNMFK